MFLQWISLSRTDVKLDYIPKFSVCLEKILVLSVYFKISVIKFIGYDRMLLRQDAF